jgi:hypothetical protein
MPKPNKPKGNNMTERQQLLEEAKALGLSFAGNAKTDNIKKAVEQAKAEAAEEEAYEDAGGEPAVAAPTESEIRAQLEAEFKEKLESEKKKLAANMEVNMSLKSDESANNRVTIGQAKLRARKEATKLVRVNVTCKDPMKSAWEGEIISVGNDVIGDIKKYVPFDTEDGWHIPQMILNVLESKECTLFKQKRGRDGKNVSDTKQIKAYSIEYLEPLTTEEMNELARDQVARQAID